MDERARRIGENEALFRDVNERIEDVNRAFSTMTERIEIVCECGSSACVGRLTLDVADYERVRSDGALFFVLPGHEIPGVEAVVEQHGDWAVVRKHPGGPADLARDLDPRDD